MQHRGLIATVLLAALGASLAACATSPTTPAAPVIDGTLLTTGSPVTVIDAGDGPELCLGAVLTSLPPQCSGPALVDWDWSALSGEYEERSGVRWGEFFVTGTYDASANSFTAIDTASGADFTWPESDTAGFRTPCPEPAGGWRVLDPATTTSSTMDAAFARAATLDGYSAAWMDQSMNPAAGSTTLSPEEELATMNDPAYVIVNVSVTGDLAVAEKELRQVWGGMLCVTRGIRTEVELLQIQDRIIAATDPAILSVGADGINGLVEVSVVYDEGDALQGEFDATYGAELVRVSSVLVPVG